MRHFGVELRAVIAARLVRDHRKGRAFGSGDNLEAGGKARHLVAVAHPHLVALAHLPQPIEQRARFGHRQESAPEFAAFTRLVPRADLAAKLLAHHLLAITDAQNRQAAVKQQLRCARAAFIADRCGRA